VPRRNERHAKGRNSGRKFDKRRQHDELDVDAIRYAINSDAKMFRKMHTH